MDVRWFVIQIPYLCRAKNAAKWSLAARLVFDAEKGGEAVLARNADDLADPFNRTELAFGFTAFEHDKDRADHCKNLLALFMLAHYKKQHGENQHDAKIADLWATCAEKEALYPDIAQVMSADAAAEDGGW